MSVVVKVVFSLIIWDPDSLFTEKLPFWGLLRLTTYWIGPIYPLVFMSQIYPLCTSGSGRFSIGRFSDQVGSFRPRRPAGVASFHSLLLLVANAHKMHVCAREITLSFPIECYKAPY